MEKAPITAEEQARAEVFYLTLGRAMAAWSTLESSLEQVFCLVTKLNPVIGKRVFHSARSFTGRYDMLSGALDSVTSRPGTIAALKAILAKARAYSLTRNSLAHDSVAFVNDHASAHHRCLVIFPSQEFWDDPDRLERPLGQEEIETAWRNFGNLNAVIAAAFNPGGDPQTGAPERLLRLVGELPRIAHERRLDPKIAAELELGLRPLPWPE